MALRGTNALIFVVIVTYVCCFTMAHVRNWSYLGCFVDSARRDLPYLTSIGNGNSISGCIDHCYAEGYKYAGLQAGTWCTCGDTYGRYGSVSNSQCNTVCPRGHGSCGAPWRNSIYKAEAPAGTYLGCFKDASQRDLPVLTSFGNSMSLSVCIKSCSDTGYKYAGLQGRSWCLCGNSYGRHGRAPNSECAAMPCPGAPGVKCGAGWRNGIYEIL